MLCYVGGGANALFIIRRPRVDQNFAVGVTAHSANDNLFVLSFLTVSFRDFLTFCLHRQTRSVPWHRSTTCDFILIECPQGLALLLYVGDPSTSHLNKHWNITIIGNSNRFLWWRALTTIVGYYVSHAIFCLRFLWNALASIVLPITNVLKKKDFKLILTK